MNSKLYYWYVICVTFLRVLQPNSLSASFRASMTSHIRTIRLSSLAVVIGLTLTSLAWAVPAAAQHRARVSRGLEEKLAAGGGDETKVIYQGPQAEADRLASAYGLKVTKRLAGGAVLSGQKLHGHTARGCAGTQVVDRDFQQSRRHVGPLALEPMTVPRLDHTRIYQTVTELSELSIEERVGGTNHLSKEAPFVGVRDQILHHHAFDHFVTVSGCGRRSGSSAPAVPAAPTVV